MGISNSQDVAQPRVLTINVKGFQLSDGGEVDDRALDAIERYIERVDPDVVLFQELDRGTTRAHGRDELAEIARRIDGTDSAFARALVHQGGDYGVGIVTRHGAAIDDAANGVNATHRIELPTSTKTGADHEQRVALVAPVTLANGSRFTVATTHVSTKQPGRAEQLGAIDDIADDIIGGAGNTAAHLPDDLPTTLVLGGDFNARRGEVQAHLDGLTHVVDGFGRTMPRLNTGIDQLYVSPGVGVSGMGLDEPERIEGSWLPFGIGGRDVYATDHPALWGTLNLPK
ncbi:MAG: endonuclease/exonuclease/phosphatase [Thermoleophilia bacterium]|nr:endonuclease/exonuclease/phosphatase [Thermoleophilia bacterium]